jgi:23S rRNA pseudouridine955/2504/2580 synthase
MPEPRSFTISEDDDGIRLDRWFKRHLPDVSFNLVSRWSRTGQLRLNGKKAAPGDRIEAGQTLQFPPAEAEPARAPRPQREVQPLKPGEAERVREMVIYSD